MSLRQYINNLFTDNSKFFNHLAFILLATGCFVRLHFYFDHKDLWLDELFLARSILEMHISEFFTKTFVNNQSAPLGFMLISKLIHGYHLNVYNLYLLPICSSLILLFASYKFIKYSFNLKHAIVYMSLFVLNYSLIYYSTELKPYIVDALVSILLLYYFIKHQEILTKELTWKFIALLCILSLLTSTLPMTLCGVACAILYRLGSIKNTLCYIKVNFIKIFTFISFYLLYYLTHLTKISELIMRQYWELSFFPLDFNQMMPWIKNVFLPVFGRTIYIPPIIHSYYGEYYLPGILFVVFFLYGSYILFNKHKELFFCTFIPLIAAVVLSALHMYPLGHVGLRGTRLVLFLYPLLLIPISTALMHLFNLLKQKTLQNILLCILVLFTLHSNINYLKRPHESQQVDKIITHLYENYTEGTKLVVYEFATDAFKVYSQGKSLNYATLDSKKDIIECASTILPTTNKIMFLFSHYDLQLTNTLADYAKNMNFEVIRIKDIGAELIILIK